MKKKTAKRRRLVQGRDYHGWAWKPNEDNGSRYPDDGLFHWAESRRPTKEDPPPTPSGKWVKVRFVEVP